MTRKEIQVKAKDYFDNQGALYERIPEAVIRELIQNASDSLFIFQLCHRDVQEEPHITVGVLEDRGFFVRDNGLGLTSVAREALSRVRFSGTREELKKIHDDFPASASKSLDSGSPEGRFGVGIYATALVASRVVLKSKSRVDNEAWDWVFYPEDYTYDDIKVEGADAKNRAYGTTVEVHLTSDSPHRTKLDSEEALTALVKSVADFVTWPIYLNGQHSETMNRRHGPWDFDQKTLASDAYLLYLREINLLGEEEEPLFIAPLPWDSKLGLGGVLFASARAGSEKGISLHLNRYFVNRSVEFLPHEFPWIQGVVLARDLKINEARERIINDAQLEYFKSRLLSWILSGKPIWDAPDSLLPKFLRQDGNVPDGGIRYVLTGASNRIANRFRQHYRLELIELATRSPTVMSALGRHLELPLLLGQFTTIAEQHSTSGKDPAEDHTKIDIHVLRKDEDRASATEFAKHGTSVIDATDRLIDTFLVQVADAANLNIRAIGPNVAIVPPDPHKWAPLKKVIAQQPGVSSVEFVSLGDAAPISIDDAKLRKNPVFKLIGGDPLEFLRIPIGLFRPEDLRVRRKIFESLKVGMEWPLLLNVDHPLVTHLLHASRDTDDQRLNPIAAIAISFAIAQLGIAWDPSEQRDVSNRVSACLQDLVDVVEADQEREEDDTSCD